MLMNRKLIVTTSWDDGYPADLRVAELLAKHGVAGTFYVPNRNSEGRPVLSEQEIRRLSATFEIGGHSIDHIVLKGLDHREAARQVETNKKWLEDVTGRPVHGFCYVRGRYDPQLKAIVQQAGFDYARTVENLHAAIGDDPFEMPTTVQLFPHRPSVYLRNFARGRLESARTKLLWASLTPGGLEQRAERLIEQCRRTGGYFHLWGHSWELEELNLWDTLDSILGMLAVGSDSIEFVTNHGANCATK